MARRKKTLTHAERIVAANNATGVAVQAFADAVATLTAASDEHLSVAEAINEEIEALIAMRDTAVESAHSASDVASRIEGLIR